MVFRDMLDEYQLELSDIRWYLCLQLTEKILSYKESWEDINHYIWSGKLEDQLYNIEERFVDEMTRELNENRTDESKIREILEEIDEAKSKRTFT